MFGRNNDGDQAELLARRMEQYEQTLRVMYQRIKESRSHLHALGFNYEKLIVSHNRTEIGRLNFIEELYSDNDNVERATGTEGNLCSMPYLTVVQADQFLMKKLWEPVNFW